MAEEKNKQKALEEAIEQGIDEIDQTVRKSGKHVFEKLTDYVSEKIIEYWEQEKTKIKYKITKGLRHEQEKQSQNTDPGSC